MASTPFWQGDDPNASTAGAGAARITRPTSAGGAVGPPSAVTPNPGAQALLACGHHAASDVFYRGAKGGQAGNPRGFTRGAAGAKVHPPSPPVYVRRAAVT